jgi:hypothetical protein
MVKEIQYKPVQLAVTLLQCSHNKISSCFYSAVLISLSCLSKAAFTACENLAGH